MAHGVVPRLEGLPEGIGGAKQDILSGLILPVRHSHLRAFCRQMGISPYVGRIGAMSPFCFYCTNWTVALQTNPAWPLASLPVNCQSRLIGGVPTVYLIFTLSWP